MPSPSTLFAPAGPTVALSVVAASHVAVDLIIENNTTANYCALLNVGATTVAVRLSQDGAAATLPTDPATTGRDFVLPPLMTMPIYLPMPQATANRPAKITAIGAGAGPTLLYATPCTHQG